MIENSSITTIIYSWMLNNLKLSGMALIVYSILYSNGQMTQKQLIDCTGMTDRGIAYSLDYLCTVRYVNVIERLVNGRKTRYYLCSEKFSENISENFSEKEKKSTKRKEVSIEDYPISKFLIKETKDIHSTKVDDSTKDIVDNSHKKDTTIPKEKVNKFIPPTVEQVRVYCEERKNGIDAENFVNFYESKGWMIGKNKMKNWKAAVRTWENKRKEAEKEKEPKKYAQLDDIF